MSSLSSSRSRLSLSRLCVSSAVLLLFGVVCLLALSVSGQSLPSSSSSTNMEPPRNGTNSTSGPPPPPPSSSGMPPPQDSTGAAGPSEGTLGGQCRGSLAALPPCNQGLLCNVGVCFPNLFPSGGDGSSISTGAAVPVFTPTAGTLGGACLVTGGCTPGTGMDLKCAQPSGASAPLCVPGGVHGYGAVCSSSSPCNALLRCTSAGVCDVPRDDSPCQTNSDCGGITTGQICSRGFCRDCGILCQTVSGNGTSPIPAGTRDQLLALLAQAGSTDSYTTIVPKGDVPAQISGGRLQPAAGAVLVLDTATLGTQLQRLDFSTSGSSAAQVQGGQSLSIPTVSSSSSGAQILVGSGARLDGASLQITTGSQLSLSLQQGTKAVPTIASFDRADLSGVLNVVGNGSTSVLQFSSVTVHEGAQINVDGGVALRGSSSTCAISIVGTASNTGTAQQNSYATVEANQHFESSGEITGASATIIVSGSFDYSGAKIEPALNLTVGASVRISQEGATTVRAGRLNFDTTSTSVGPDRPSLQINATARDSGARVIFDGFNCPATAIIKVNLAAGISRDTALRSDGGVSIVSYTSVDAAAVKTFHCDLTVCDSTGCTQIVNPNAVITASVAARRLLETSSTAVWTTHGVSAQSKDVTQAAAGLQASHAILALMIVAVAALQRMF